jgi:hypothetical protein
MPRDEIGGGGPTPIVEKLPNCELWVDPVRDQPERLGGCLWPVIRLVVIDQVLNARS